MTIEIVDLPIKNGDFPMLNYQSCVQYGWKIWKSGVLMGCFSGGSSMAVDDPSDFLVIFMGKIGNMILPSGKLT